MLNRSMRLGVIALALMSSISFAQRKYGMGGCGLGSLIISPGGMQSLAATTNGYTYTNFFGITSGTSNCEPSEDMAKLDIQEKFIIANLGTLSKEMAQGSGTSLLAFSETFGCDAGITSKFNAQLQNNYQEIFAAPGAIAVLDSAKTYLRLDSAIAESCQDLHI